MTEVKPPKRKKPSPVSTIVSLTLVMFLLGLFGLSVVFLHGFKKTLVESAGVDVYFKDSTSELEIKRLQQSLEKESWCLKTRFITREEGIKEMGDLEDEALENYISVQAIPLSLEVFFKSDFATEANISNVAKRLKGNTLVESVDYQSSVLTSMHRFMRRLQYALLAIALIFVAVAMGLIYSSTRLTIFANRFIIKSMQLVGATNWFIVRPIMGKFAGYALLAWPLAIAMCVGILYLIPIIWPELPLFQIFIETANPFVIGLIAVVLLIFGIFLSVFSAWLSTRKYLRTKIENLY